MPPPPYYKHSAACAHATCTLQIARSGIRTQRGRVRVEVFSNGSNPSDEITYIALYDASGKLFYTSPKQFASYAASAPGYPHTGLQVDKAGRVFVPLSFGAHSGSLVVLDANGATVKDFGTISHKEGDFGVFGSDTPGEAGLDLDGDGINEVDVLVNDYTPNYAEGTTTERYYAYKAGTFALIGCTKLSQSQGPYSGPKAKVGSAGCKP